MPAQLPRPEVLTLPDGGRVHLWSTWSGRDGRDRRELPILVAFHGWTDSGAVFAPLARALDGVCEVVAPNAPGHGGTPWDLARPLSFPAMAPPALAAFDAVRDRLGPDRPVVLLGHSMGALIAARLAGARPDAVAHLVIEEPPVKPPLPWLFRRRDTRWLRRLQALDDAGRIELFGARTGWSAEEMQLWSAAKAQADPEVLGSLRRHQVSLTAPLRHTTCPVTLIIGSNGRHRLSSAALARYGAACSAGSTVVRLSTGHNPRRDDPQGYLSALRAVIAKAAIAAQPLAGAR
jgi:pimeloyl-ACP methyl ester carboxylesterase